jgi:hypothetical protein
MRNACRIFVGNSERKRANGRPRQMVGYNKTDLTEIKYRCVDRPAGSGKCSVAFASVVMNL